MKMRELTNQIQQAYSKYFTDSKCSVVLSSNLYHSVSIACFLANNKTELSGGYWENDMFSIRFSIDTETGEFSKDLTLDSEVPNNARLTVSRKSYALKPPSRYFAFGTKQLAFRKTVGEGEKIVKSLDKFFSKLHAELLQDIKADLIHDNHKALLASKIK